MSSGNFTVNNSTITLEPGNRHNEERITVKENELTVVTPDGTQSLSLNEGPGLYLLNLKKDTIVGSYQRVGTNTDQIKISREELKHRMDSLVALMSGSNVSAENRNYCIAPLQVQKITDNKAADVYGPFVTLPASFEPDKEYEIYKFHTNKDVVEIIEKLKPMVEEASTE